MENLTEFIRAHFGVIGSQHGGDLSITDVQRASRIRGAICGDDALLEVDSAGVGVIAAFSTLLGRYPSTNNMQVLHLSEYTCDILFGDTYQMPDVSPALVVWGEHRSHDGDLVAKAYIGPLDEEPSSAMSPMWTEGRTFVGNEVFHLRDRTMILAPTLTEGVEVMTIQFGPIVLTPPTIAYTHFGISVPSSYVPRVCVRAFGMRAPCVFLRTGSVGDGAVDKRTTIPTFNFSRPLVGSFTRILKPPVMLVCQASWLSGAASTLSLVDVEFFAVSHVAYRARTPRAIRIVISDIGSNATSVFACSMFEQFLLDAAQTQKPEKLHTLVDDLCARLVTWGTTPRNVTRVCRFQSLDVKGTLPSEYVNKLYVTRRLPVSVSATLTHQHGTCSDLGQVSLRRA